MSGTTAEGRHRAGGPPDRGADQGADRIAGQASDRMADQGSDRAGRGAARAAEPGRGQEGRRRTHGGERAMVPPAEFTSYYGRQVVKPAPWRGEIPAYMFAGGLAAGSSLLAAGADLTGRAALRRSGRLTALGALGFSMAALVRDLGRPERFLNMMRTVKLTSPMSVGTWILALYGPPAGLAAAAEVAGMLLPGGAGTAGGAGGAGRAAGAGRLGISAGRLGGPFRLLAAAGRPAGLLAGLLAPPVAAYTAVLLSDTATPSWHEAYRELPFVFCGSAAAAAGGLAAAVVPADQAGPARRLAVGGAVAELLAEHRMERSMGITAEPLRTGVPGKLMRAARVLTLAGTAGTLLPGRSRAVALVSGAALVTASVCTRFGVVRAGIASAKDPRYTVVPQRERVDRGEPVRYRG